jgi:hypothetical protein
MPLAKLQRKNEVRLGVNTAAPRVPLLLHLRGKFAWKSSERLRGRGRLDLERFFAVLVIEVIEPYNRWKRY